MKKFSVGQPCEKIDPKKFARVLMATMDRVHELHLENPDDPNPGGAALPVFVSKFGKGSHGQRLSATSRMVAFQMFMDQLGSEQDLPEDLFKIENSEVISVNPYLFHAAAVAPLDMCMEFDREELFKAARSFEAK
jgi:hypothetical protein